jgi:hypothetical protein
LNGTTGTCSAKTNGIFNGTAQFQIGASETASPGNPGNAVDGLLAYAHVYNRSLSIDERNIIRYCPGSITSGLVAYFPIWGSSDPEMNLITASETMTVSGPVESTDGPPISLGCGGLQ